MLMTVTRVEGGGTTLLTLNSTIWGDTVAMVRDHFCSDDPNYADMTPALYLDSDDVAVGGDKFRFDIVLREGSPRSFFLDFSDNCEMDCDARPELVDQFGNRRNGNLGLTSGGHENVFSTGEAESLLDIPEGETRYRDFGIRFRDDNDDHWKLLFWPSECPGTAQLRVTRGTGGAVDTWSFVSTSERACLQRRARGRGPTTSHGLYTLPFLLTVILIP